MTSHALIKHELFDSPGYWLGKGNISFSESDESFTFYTRWTVADCGPASRECNQEIEIEGLSERLQNSYMVRDVTLDSFAIELLNPVLGQVEGKGLIDNRVIAWEFRNLTTGGFEGYESYELQKDGSYRVHAEYTSTSQLRTIVDGEIWKARGKVSQAE